MKKVFYFLAGFIFVIFMASPNSNASGDWVAGTIKYIDQGGLQIVACNGEPSDCFRRVSNK